jgi:hypothetical protein
MLGDSSRQRYRPRGLDWGEFDRSRQLQVYSYVNSSPMYLSVMMALLALAISVFPWCTLRLWAYLRLHCGLHRFMATIDGWLLSGSKSARMGCRYAQASRVTSIPLAVLCYWYCLGSSNPASLLTLFLGPHQQKSLSLYPNSAGHHAEHNHLFQACKNSLWSCCWQILAVYWGMLVN